MKRILLAIALVSAAACADVSDPDPQDDPTVMAGEMASLFPSPEDNEPTYIPPKPYRVIPGNVVATCAKQTTVTATCRSRVAQAGNILYQYMKQIHMNSLQASVQTSGGMAAVPGGLSYVYANGNYSASCTGPTTSMTCLVKFLGAGLITIAVPEACATVALCAGAIAGAGLAWYDYHITPDDGTGGIWGGYRGTWTNNEWHWSETMHEYPEGENN
jgi:hypothetical protein